MTESYSDTEEVHATTLLVLKDATLTERSRCKKVTTYMTVRERQNYSDGKGSAVARIVGEDTW